MATINVYQAQDGSKTYRVRIRRTGQPVQTASFSNLQDAKRWATMIEGQIIEGRHFPNNFFMIVLAINTIILINDYLF